MMIEQDHWTEIGQRVALIGEAEGLYKSAYTGSPGWVRAQMKDEFGFPMVRIEWDKTWWGYNGEKDDWFIESHFEPVKEILMSEDAMPSGQMPPEVAAGLMSWLASQAPQTPAQNTSSPVPDSEVQEHQVPTTPAEIKAMGTTDQTYAETVRKGAEFSQDADAVLIIAVKKLVSERGNEFAPNLVFSYKDPAAGVVLEMQLAKIAATAMQDSGVMALKLLKDQAKG